MSNINENIDENINKNNENIVKRQDNNVVKTAAKWIIFGLVIVILLFLDQWTKSLAVSKLMKKDAFVILDGIFELTYVENRGAAFGMLAGGVDFFVIITCILVPILVYIVHKIDVIVKTYGDTVNTIAYKILQVDLVILIAGALGNFIDRLVNGYVVDFFYFKLIDFPVFNVADIYVTVSTIVLLFIMFFILKERELDYIISSKKKWEEITVKNYDDDKNSKDLDVLDDMEVENKSEDDLETDNIDETVEK